MLNVNNSIIIILRFATKIVIVTMRSPLETSMLVVDYFVNACSGTLLISLCFLNRGIIKKC